jgi:hypothetical protein
MRAAGLSVWMRAAGLSVWMRAAGLSVWMRAAGLSGKHSDDCRAAESSFVRWCVINPAGMISNWLLQNYLLYDLAA